MTLHDLTHDSSAINVIGYFLTKTASILILYIKTAKIASSKMFTTRTVASFAKVAKNLRNLSAFRQNIHVCPLNKRAPALRLPLLKFEMTVAVQVRAYAKGKDKKKEKGV